MSDTEAATSRALLVLIASMTFVLVLQLLEKTLSRDYTNFMPADMIPVILMCHVVGVSVTMPEAAEQFNLQMMRVLTYNFFRANILIEHLTGKESGRAATTGLATAGY